MVKLFLTYCLREIPAESFFYICSTISHSSPESVITDSLSRSRIPFTLLTSSQVARGWKCFLIPAKRKGVTSFAAFAALRRFLGYSPPRSHNLCLRLITIDVIRHCKNYLRLRWQRVEIYSTFTSFQCQLWRFPDLGERL